MKGLRVTIIFAVTAFIMAFGLGFLSAWLESRGERPIPETNRLMMVVSMSGVVASIAASRGLNRKVFRAGAGEEAEAKRCAPVAGLATVYVFRDAFIGKVAGLDVLLDGAPVGQTRGKTFYRFQLPPGEHLITSRNPRDNSQHEHRVRADAGSLLFLDQDVKFGLKHALVPTEQATAMPRVQRCRLLLPSGN